MNNSNRVNKKQTNKKNHERNQNERFGYCKKPSRLKKNVSAKNKGPTRAQDEQGPSRPEVKFPNTKHEFGITPRNWPHNGLPLSKALAITPQKEKSTVYPNEGNGGGSDHEPSRDQSVVRPRECEWNPNSNPEELYPYILTNR